VRKLSCVRGEGLPEQRCNWSQHVAEEIRRAVQRRRSCAPDATSFLLFARSCLRTPFCIGRPGRGDGDSTPAIRRRGDISWLVQRGVVAARGSRTIKSKLGTIRPVRSVRCLDVVRGWRDLFVRCYHVHARAARSYRAHYVRWRTPDFRPGRAYVGMDLCARATRARRDNHAPLAAAALVSRFRDRLHSAELQSTDHRPVDRSWPSLLDFDQVQSSSLWRRSAFTLSGWAKVSGPASEGMGVLGE
jgi:hypothetical protein